LCILPSTCTYHLSHVRKERGSKMVEALCSQTEAYWFYFGYSRVYERMQKYFTSNEMREEGLNLANIHDASMKVLDVGAGTGTLSKQLVQRVDAANLTLIDQSPHMLEQAKAKPELMASTFVLADAHELPFDDASFDRVVSSGVIYYFPDPVRALREQLRVTRPGGVVLAMGSLQPKPLLIRFFATVFNRFPTEKQYVSWFEDAGFSNVQYKYISNPWNHAQYALAICGTKSDTTPQPARAMPPAPTLGRRLRKLLYLPLAVARFGLGMWAFAIIGPLQVLNASRGMRQLEAAASQEP